jgi:SnoaL-like polyketide cyclase.
MRELVERYIDAYNRKAVDGMLATVHREVVFENYTAGVLSVRRVGIEELRQLAESSRHLFSARRQTVTAWHQQGDAGYAQIHFEGTFAVDLPSGARAGQVLSLTGRSEFRQRDGLLIYIADYSD